MRRASPLVLALALAALAAAPVAAQTVFALSLDESQEVPPTGSSAVGDCVAQLDAFEGALAITCVHDVAGPTGAHIHAAPPGVNGGIVFPFPSAVSPIDGVWELGPDDVAALEAGNLYVNVHSGAFPNGEIRGQFTPAAAEAYSFALDGGQEVPPTGSAAVGVCDAALDDGESRFTIACHHDVSGVTGAHIHNAEAGVGGPIVFPFPAAQSPMFGIWDVAPADVVELRTERLYVNVHSGAFPDGEIRGQILPAAAIVFGDGFESGDTSRWTTTVE
jgi:Cu/Zn superoxide dismutase